MSAVSTSRLSCGSFLCSSVCVGKCSVLCRQVFRLSLSAKCSASVLCFVSVLFDCQVPVDSLVAAFSVRRAHSHFVLLRPLGEWWRHVVSAECSYRRSLSAKCFFIGALWLPSAYDVRSLVAKCFMSSFSASSRRLEIPMSSLFVG